MSASSFAYVQQMMGDVVDSFHGVFGQLLEARSFGSGGRTALLVVISLVTVALASMVRTLWSWSVGKEEQLRSSSLGRTPRGDYGLPFLGEILNFSQAYYNGAAALKSFLSQKAAKYGPVFRFAMLNSTRNVFVDAPGGNKILFNHSSEALVENALPKQIELLLGEGSLQLLTGESHKTERKYLLQYFLGIDRMPRHLEIMQLSARQNVQKLWVDDKEDGSELVVCDLMKVLTFGLICNLCLGVTDEADVKKLNFMFADWTRGLLALPVNLPGFQFHRSMRARAGIMKFLKQHLQTRKQDLEDGRATATQDYLSILLTRPGERGDLHDDDFICTNLLQLLSAGHDTTSATLTMVIIQCARYPEVYEKLINEHASIAARKAEGELLTIEDVRAMKYTWQTVQETLRLYPAVLAISRTVKTSFEYKGFTIPQGWKVFTSLPSSHLNPAFFENPEKFDPSRFAKHIPPFTYFPFGGGAQICPGIEFARTSTLVFLHHLLKNVKWTLVNPDQKIVYDFMPRPTDGARIEIKPCKSF